MTQAAVAPAPPDTAARQRLVQLCLAGALAYCSYAMCRSPLLPLFARELGADARVVGLVVGTSTVTGILVKLPAGAWSDIVGRRTMLIVGALVFASLPFTYLAVSGLGVLVALRFVHGNATAIFGPVASASLSDIAPPNRRGTWLSTYSTVQGVGQAIGPVLAGYAIAAGRFDLAFIGAGVVALGVPFMVARWPAAPAVAVAHRSSPVRLLVVGVRDVFREPQLLVTSMAQAAQFLLNGSLNAFLPLYARDTLGMDAAAVGWLFAMQTITTLAARPIIGALSDRVGRRGVIVTGLLACSSAVCVISAATAVATLVFGVLAYAAGVAVTTAATSAYITDVAPKSRYGAAHGAFGTIYDVGDAAGPILAGLLVATWGYEAMFRTMSAAAAVAALMFAWLSRRDTRMRDVSS
jgi:MFS transporter, DHA1 family, multidrug resistance protein